MDLIAEGAATSPMPSNGRTSRAVNVQEEVRARKEDSTSTSSSGRSHGQSAGQANSKASCVGVLSGGMLCRKRAGLAAASVQLEREADASRYEASSMRKVR